ncbi:MAG: hypothetical protein KDA68_11800 [Planctomycetaceae bacterium]|nr:hypothetical protein [Planctomycetaceae bacterium]
MGTAWAWIIGYAVLQLALSKRAYETPVVLRDGRLAVLVKNEQLETREGEKIEIPMGEHVSTYSTRLYASYLPPTDDKTSFYFGQDWESRIMAHIDEQSSSVWYAIQENAKEGSMFLQGFSYPDGKEVGYIGKKGFQETKPQGDELFDLPTGYNSFLYMVSPTGIHSRQLSLNGLYQGYLQKTRGQQEGELVLAPWNQPLLRIDLRERTVVELLPGEKVCSVYPVSDYIPQIPIQAGNSVTEADYRHSVIIRTDRDLVKFPVKDGKISKTGLLRVTIPEEVRGKHLGWHRFPNGSGLVFARGDLDSSKRNREYVFYRHDRSGKIGSAERMSYLEDSSQGWGEAGFVAIFPSVILVPCVIMLASSDTYEEILIRQLLPISPAVGCLCGLMMVIHGRRRRLSGVELTCWGLFGILFGVLGLLGYLTHRIRPEKVPCPSCGRREFHREESCLKCGQEFPASTTTGLEILA